MATNKVQVDFEIGSDTLTPALNRIRGMSDQMKSSFGSDALKGFFEGAGIAAFTTAINTAQSALSGLQSQVSKGIKLQVDSLVSASGLRESLNVPLEQAKSITQNMMENIGKVSAALPGSEEDFLSMYNAIAPSVAKGSGGDADRFKQDAMDLVSRFTVLGVSKGVSIPNAGGDVDRLIQGTAKTGELGLNDIFQKTGFIQKVNEEARKAGFASMDAITNVGERLKVIRSSLDRAVPKDLIEGLTNTFSSQIASLQSSLFGTTQGVFGSLRKIPEMGGRSMLDGVQSLFNSLGEFFGKLGDLGKAAGLSFDPGAKILAFLDLLKGVTDGLTGALGGKSIDFGAIAQNLGKGLSDFLAYQMKVLANTPMLDLGVGFGRFLGTLIDAFVQNIPNIAAFFTDGMIGTLSFLAGAVLGVCQQLAISFGAMLQPVVDGSIALIGQFFNWVGTAFQSAQALVDGAIGSIRGLFDLISSAVNSIQIPGVGGGSLGSVESAASSAIGFASPILGAAAKVGSFLFGNQSSVPQAGLPFQQNTSGAQPQQVAFAPAITITGNNGYLPSDLAAEFSRQLNESYQTFKQGAIS